MSENTQPENETKQEKKMCSRKEKKEKNKIAELETKIAEVSVRPVAMGEYVSENQICAERFLNVTSREISPSSLNRGAPKR